MALRNWAGNITFSTSVLHQPTSVAELQDLVAGRARIRALGSGHSFNPIADTTGELVSTRALAGPIEFDERAGLVSVPAGRRYGEITGVLQDAGVALPNLGSLPHISVAGACATGTHGSGDTNRNLPSAVEAVEFVRADGELVRLSRSADPDTFPGAVLSLGALGIVTRVSLATEPTFDVRQDVWLDMPTGAFIDNVGEVMAAGYSVSVFTDWRRADTVDKVWVKRRVDAAGPPDPLLPADWLGAHLATEAQHPITGEDTTAATPQLGVPGPWLARLPHFRLEFTPSTGRELQSEYVIARADAAAGVRALRAVAGIVREPLMVCEMRTIAADDLWLSPSYRRDSFAFHFTWVDDPPRVRPVLAAIESALAPFAPRPHWGKVFTMPRADIDPHYPRRADFRHLVERYDPAGKFGNEFLDAHLPTA